MLKVQNIILEMIAKGDTLADTATRMCLEVENLVPNVICSILKVDLAGYIHPLAGPSLPSSYSAALNGLKIGPRTGSCGAAAYSLAEVAVVDIATDDRWDDFKHLALPLGLKACWSSPIIGADGTVIGTFAFYYRDCRGPTVAERAIVQQFIHLSVIALDRHQRVVEYERRAFTDALTGLANRAAFNKALDMLKCDVPGDWALFVLDLDNLKVINDTFGHQAGDCLLQIAGERFADAVSPNPVFRIGGDEFAAIIHSESALRDLQGTADRILSMFAEPADCAGNLVSPRATIGGAVISAGDRVAERVRQHADFALYHAKETGRGGFVRYWPGLGSNITRRLGNIRDVDAALRDDRIEAYYQPVVRLDTREIVGLEALCRMRLGDRIISAVDFQEATKDVHVSTALTARMIELVAADVREWLDMGIPFQHVGINVSSADMHGGLLEKILVEAFSKECVPLSHVVLEITEAVYLGQGNRIVQKSVEALRGKGLRVALDDFGTGFASLTHLLTVPVDILKIDKSFVDRLAPGDAGTAIVEGLIHIAKQLNIRVVAEGIETEEQATRLEAAGCVLGQGYLFSRAVDRQSTTRLLAEHAQYLGSPMGTRSKKLSERSGRGTF